MRKIIVLSMLSLDGVMQAPGGADEDRSGGFKFGGWAMQFGDEVDSEQVKMELNQSAEYLLGRKTFDIWESYWPEHGDIWPGINSGRKYVLSASRNSSDWKKTLFIKGLEDIIGLKATDGPDIQVWGSSELVRLLLAHELVDELRLKIYPLLLGEGKKLFDGSAIPTGFVLIDSIVTTKGVILANYRSHGKYAVDSGN